MYNYFSNYDSAKHVCEVIKKKYDIEEVGAQKNDFSNYLKYQMVDERSVETQSHKLQKISYEIITKGMCYNNSFKLLLLLTNCP